jgi:hypothetical protein
MTRDPRLDVFRGMALVIILIDHLPGNFWSKFTLGQLGLSDAAEGFVLISGIATGLAYGDAFRRPPQIMTGLRRIGHRVWTIYMVQIVITVFALGLSAALARWFSVPDMAGINQAGVVFADPQSAMIRIPLLAQHLNYVDILPVYIALLTAAPLMLCLAWRWPLALLTASVGLWVAASLNGWNLPNHPGTTGWFFNPLAWQLIFVIGILIATAMKQGRRLVPATPLLLVPACIILVFGFVHQRVAPWSDVNWALPSQTNLPDLFTSVQKTFLPLPRLLHMLTLAYVLSCFAVVRQVCASRPLAPFALLGRHALPVFATICVLNFAMQLVRVKTGIDFALDSAMLAVALALVFALAAARQYWPR